MSKVFKLTSSGENRRILQIKRDADFVNLALFIFTRAKHVVLTVQGQRMCPERRIRNDLADETSLTVNDSMSHQ